jgi:putative peptidoglycan lipid II flippase
VKILAPGFYARQDIRTPVKVAVATLVITQLLNVVFVHYFRHAGLALSISIGALFNAGLLWFLMLRRGAYRPLPGWGAFLFRLVVALYAMGGAIWHAMGRESSWFEVAAAPRAGKLALVIVAATAAYFATLWLMGMRRRDFVRHEPAAPK